MYGYDVNSLDDKWVELADESLLMGASLLLPGASLMNVFPILQHVPKWFPGASAKRTAEEVKKLTEYLIQSPFDWVKKRMVSGSSMFILYCCILKLIGSCKTGGRNECTISGLELLGDKRRKKCFARGRKNDK